jgi:hypothetical protein
MSKYKYRDYHLTYYLPRLDGASGLFVPELIQVISRAISPICTNVKVSLTLELSERPEEVNNRGVASTICYGKYCIFVFENDEDRHMFKLSIPSDHELAVLVQDVLNILD